MITTTYFALVSPIFLCDKPYMNLFDYAWQPFWVTKLILWLYVFVHFSQKPRNLMFFMGFGPRRSFYEKSSGGQNFNLVNFNFKLFLNRLTDQLHTWYDGRTTGLTFNDIFFDDLDSRSKVKFQGQTGNQVLLSSYLKTYLTHRLHTW